ncbi:hypothetical protein THMIRHAS_01630 [Thiosulfatimonas sediminis]|uniref:ABC transporter substrate-binding protein n=1 Tax=Thiosulfatimonas sediminis TaxID=2675054 RepID=A0A6F8PS25_9GAMM|nr:phosphate/phosphite/phosphonate ABC transporter substrate-binding protein [Thiosulfatimonas sediminis]BBP44790.1 hypothetical protein THMIRHAS_01630 [Thiosulfatimonas sediminis]
MKMLKLRHSLHMTLLFILLFNGLAHAQQTPPSLNMALFPYATPPHLIQAHQPLKTHFSDVLQTPIHFISAPNFARFSAGIRAETYDIILAAPHMGRLAELSGQYEWLGFTRNQSYAVIVTNQAHPAKRLQDFTGQQIILPPRTAIVNYLSRQALIRAGLRPGIDIDIIETNSHQSAMLAVINGIYPLAGFGKPIWENGKLAGKDTLIKLFQSEYIPGFALMAHKRLGKEKITLLRHAFLTFDTTAAGKGYFSAQGLQGGRPQTPQDMPQLDAFLNELGMLNPEHRKEQVE